MRNQTVIAIAFAMLVVSAVNSTAAVYLKSDATGNGSGSSWANACTNLTDAYAQLLAKPDTEADRTLYVAGGIYKTANLPAAVPFGALRIYGGYRAASDGDMVRDIEEYQTIFSGFNIDKDRLGSALWRRITPTLGAYSATEANTSSKLIVDGKLNLIPPTGDYDALYTSDASGTTIKPISFKDGTGGVVSGIKFVGYARDNQGSCILVSAGSTGNAGTIVVENCTFAALAAQTGVIGIQNNTVANLTVTNCLFYGIKHQASSGSTIWYASTASGSVVDCSFIGCYKNDNYAMAPVINCSTAPVSVRRCTFTHCFTACGNNNGAAALLYDGSGVFEDCIATNNFISWTTISSAGQLYGPSLIIPKGGSVKNSLFANNRVEAKPTSGTTVIMFGGPMDSKKPLFTNCLFTANALAAPQSLANSGSRYTLAVAGGYSEKTSTTKYASPSFRNCVFENNSLEPTEDLADVTALLCDGVVMADHVTQSASEVNVSHCTFLKNAANGAYAIVETGNSLKSMTVADSIFELASGDIYSNFVMADKPAAVSFRNCTVRNLVAENQPEDVDVTAGLAFDPVSFVRQPFMAGFSIPVPNVNTPLISSSTDGTVRGAVDSLSSVAATGKTLTIRRSPFSGGTVDIPSQSVPTGTAISPVTATGNGSTFLGWFDDPAGTAISSDNPLAIASLDEDTILYAKFGTASVGIVFDLGDAGVFTQNSENEITISASVGEPFPAIPAFTPNDEYHIWDWDDMPAIVPQNGATYRAKYVTRSVRDIPVAVGGDLAAAIEDAGHWAGRVILSAGTYDLAAPIDMPSNVSITGPTEGKATISGNGTVFSAFTDGNYATNISFRNIVFKDFNRAAISLAEGDKTVFEDCTFENCNCSQTLTLLDYGAVNILNRSVEFRNCFFTNNCRAIVVSDTTATTNLFLSCKFTDNLNGSVAFWNTASGYTLFTNCVFNANRANRYDAGSGNYLVAPALMFNNTGLHDSDIVDCVIDGSVVSGTGTSPVLLLGEKDSVALRILRTRFTNNANTSSHSNYKHAGAIYFDSKTKRILIRDCVFAGNSVHTTAGNTAAGAFLYPDNRNHYVTVLNSVFENNSATTSGSRAGTIVHGGYAKAAIVNCLFNGNTFAASGTNGKAADIVKDSGGADYTCYLSAINNVMKGGDGYLPFADMNSMQGVFGYNAADGYDHGEFADIATIVHVGTNWTPAPGLICHAVESTAACRYRGFDRIYLLNGSLYANSAEISGKANKPWMRLDDRAQYASFSAIPGASLLPVDLPIASLIPNDIDGNPRHPGKITPGPLNPASITTVLIVR